MVTLDGTLTFFITLELCAGGDLGARLARARERERALGRHLQQDEAAASSPPPRAPPAAPIADAVAARAIGPSRSRRASRPCTRRTSRTATSR